MKKWLSYIVDIVKEEYKFIAILIILYIIFQIPVNYYIITGGGTSDISSRIHVKDAYSKKGTFNISYVEELKGTVFSYALSYIIPTWERENADLYKYSKKESIEDIEFRSDLDLKTANGNAIYWAYKLANKRFTQKSAELYVITTFEEYKTTLKTKDRILNIDGNTYETIKEYKDYLQTKKENDTVKITIIRNKKEKQITAKLYKYKKKNILGVALQYAKTYETKPPVKIKFKSSESGPSGGLITTLEIYNQLTKKDITKGLKIAGTGTIEEDGTIGQIGGVEHKILGAESDKTDIFLVPSGENYKAALKYKKQKKLKIKIIEVKNIQDALKKLEKLK